MKIVITGHTGLIGSNLSKALSNHEVFGMSRASGHDLRNKGQVEQDFQRIKPEVVFMLSANASEAVGQHSPIDMTERNLGIFVNVLKASINAGVKKFIYTSSVAVYGEATVPYREDGATIPKDVYGVNKLACEQILKIMAKVYGFEYVIVRPHNVYGPGQNMSDLSKNVVALFMRKLIEGQPYMLYGNGEMKRQFSYVDDVVSVLKQCLDLSNITLNIGSRNAISIKELSDLLQKITGLKGQIEYKPARPQEISMFLAEHALQDEILNYAETPLEEGLVKTWEWVKKKTLLPVVKQEKEIYVSAKD